MKLEITKIKAVKASQKGKLNVSYRINGQLRNAVISDTKDIKKAVTALESGKKQVKSWLLM